jgi:Flagellar GTP-binding protein
MSQAIAKVKKELGNDAVIFHTKKVSTGHFFNLLKREHVEVIAANDPDPLFKETHSSAEKIHRCVESNRTDAAAQISIPRTAARMDKYLSGPDYLRKIEARLTGQGMKPEHVDEILKFLVKKWYQHDESLKEDEMNRLLRATLTRRLRPERFLNSADKDRFMMLVGPTGVGKTTTIAKLAGRDVLQGGEKVAFISTDTFRVAAINQLKMYADLLNIPIEVAYSSKELLTLVARYSGYNRVYIDTAGRNFQDEKYVSDVSSMIRGDYQIHLCLALAATAKREDLAKLIRSFDSLPVDQLILTKIDETSTYGAMISTLLDFPEKHVLYITNGQEVPDDLKTPDANELINLMLGDTCDK